MKALTIASRTARIILWTILGALLLVAAVVMMLFTPSMQSHLRQTLIDKLNTIPGVEARLDTFELRFPLRLDIAGLAIVQNGDTAIAASKVDAKVKLLPLLAGRISVTEAFLANARYQMGNPDSLMMLRINADTLRISPATVKLSPLSIDIADGRIAHGLVSLNSKVDTTAKAAPDSAAAAAPMTIKVERLQLDDFAYQMAMLPTIDSLGATVGAGVVEGVVIDMLPQTVDIRSFTGSGLDAAYIAPSPEQIAATPVPPPSPASAPWTVKIDTIGFANSRGLYTTRGVVPQPGLDFAYIQADSMDITVKNFYNQATTLTLPIELVATERCGVKLSAKGTYAMDSTTMYFRDFEVKTAATLLKADGLMGIGSIADDPALPLRLTARGDVGIPDLLLMFPAFKPYLAPMAKNSPLIVNLDLSGTAGDLIVDALELSVSRTATIKAHGRLADMFAAKGPSGNIVLNGNIMNVNSIVKSMASDAGLTVPPMRINGNVAMQHGAVRGKVNATTLNGRIALDGSFNGNAESYNLTLAADKFPVEAFMKDLGVGRVTATVTAKGNGFDFFKPATNLDANVAVSQLEYGGYDYRDIKLVASVHHGQARIDAVSDNDDVRANLIAYGNLDGGTYTWHAKANAANIDLKAIKMTPTEASLSMALVANATATPSRGEISATATLKELDYKESDLDYNLSDIRATFDTCDSLTCATLVNRDFHANAQLPYGLDTISSRFASFTQDMDQQIRLKELHIDSLQHLLPRFSISMMAGSDNFINDILGESKMSINRLELLADNDSAIDVKSRVLGFTTGSTRLDTIRLRVTQNVDKMHLIVNVDNRPGNLDQFAHLRLDGVANSNQIAFRASQKNLSNVTGYDIGAIALFADSTVTASIFPLNPIIGYKKWSVNLDNFISYTFPTKQIEADLHMSGEKSALALYTENKSDSLQTRNDIVLQLSDVHIQDWISINPFAPPITGDLSADMHVNWNGGDDINGKGLVQLTDFYYNRERVGDFASNLEVATNTSGMIRAQADLSVNGEKTITIAGNLNDSTAVTPFNLDFSIVKFPLAIANPFLPADMARLTGTLNGSMDINGDADKPRINGEIYFDKAAVKVPMTNTSYAFSDVKIPVKDNIVEFNGFGISGTNENPLLINGTVNMTSLMSPQIDLSAKANNIMVVNSSSAAKNALIYGKGYLNIDASVRGNMKFMAIDASVGVLSGTNVTYILDFASKTLQAPSETDMVRFVNFNDSAQVAQADTLQSGMMMDINANLNIQSGTTIVVDLNTGPRDKVQVQPQGALTYTQAPLSEGRVTGRITINNGFVRYTMPVIGSEKTFTFDPNSYIAFNGDMLNPTLNVKAVDVVKANVTQQGQNSRLVNFDVQVGVTGTLNVMDVKFDLSTNDDLTVANEIQSMSAEQRANQAMNLLLYNMYTGPGTKTTAANPLFSFLESQVNNWAAQNIKGVDLQFGIDQYNQTTNGSTSSTMNYSYQVSKTLFNDRFKIVVGGNYSTDDNADENLSQNLINDISFEYYLNKQQTMLIKLFRHTGFESILEGEITQTGVGFVYRRRLQRLSQMLPKFLRPKNFKTIDK